MRFVLDASVTLSWFVDRPVAPYAAHVKQLLLKECQAVVPVIWRLEVANGFVMTERRGLSLPSDTTEMLQALDVVLQSIETVSDSVSMRQIIAAARDFRLTAYDAAYLELARAQKLPIATLDRQIKAAAAKAGIASVQ
jgi:predicted nucleic acid-binding protein